MGLGRLLAVAALVAALQTTAARGMDIEGSGSAILFGEQDTNVLRQPENERSDTLARLFVEGRGRLRVNSIFKLDLDYTGIVKKYTEITERDQLTNRLTGGGELSLSSSVSLTARGAMTHKWIRSGQFGYLSGSGTLGLAWQAAPRWRLAVSGGGYASDFFYTDDRVEEGVRRIFADRYDSSGMQINLRIRRGFGDITYLEARYGFDQREYPHYELIQSRSDALQRLDLTFQYFDALLLHLRGGLILNTSNRPSYNYIEGKVQVFLLLPIREAWHLDFSATWRRREYDDLNEQRIEYEDNEYLITESEAENLNSLEARLGWDLGEMWLLQLRYTLVLEPDLFQAIGGGKTDYSQQIWGLGVGAEF